MSTKKLQITTPIVTSVNGKTGNVTIPTSSGGFLCTITGSGTDADPYVCDKSFDEIIQAVNDGLIPCCIHPLSDGLYGDKLLMCTYLEYVENPSAKYIIFRSTYRFGAGNENKAGDIFLHSTGDITLQEGSVSNIPTITLKTWTSSDIT